MKLRRELLPPEPDEALVAELAALAERIASTNDEVLAAEFNRKAGTTFATDHIARFYTYTEADQFARTALLPEAPAVEAVTPEELAEVTRRICAAEGAEWEHEFWLRLLQANVAVPRVSDLIYWPGEFFGDGDNSRELTPQQIVDVALGGEPTPG